MLLENRFLNEFIWNDDNLILPRCPNCFNLYPRITIDNTQYISICYFCTKNEIIKLSDYIEFIKFLNMKYQQMIILIQYILENQIFIKK